jgi:O-antigen ligase
MTIALLGLTVALLPLLAPSGPGNSAPVDAAAMLFLLAALATLAFGRQPVRTPAAPVLGAIALFSLLATAASLAPRTSMLSIVVEAYLIVLFWAAASVLDGNRRAVRRIMGVWVLSAVAWASIVLGAQYHLLPASLATLLASYDKSGRVAGAAENPNLAASYFVTSLFVLLAAPRTLPRVVRLVAAVVITWAVVVTGSNGAMLGLAVGVVVVAVGALFRRFEPMSRAVVASSAALLVTVAAAVVLTVFGPPRFTTAEVGQIAASQTAGPLDKSVGRLDNSVGVRLEIWSGGWSQGARSVAVGIGPNASNESLAIHKGLHNDYLAFLVERGIGGAVALAAFVLLLLYWSASLLVSRVPNRRRWVIGGLGGGIVANLVMAITHESFHFRHLWLLLALAWVCRRLAAAPAPRPDLIPQPSPALREEPLHTLH